MRNGMILNHPSGCFEEPPGPGPGFTWFMNPHSLPIASNRDDPGVDQCEVSRLETRVWLSGFLGDPPGFMNPHSVSSQTCPVLQIVNPTSDATFELWTKTRRPTTFDLPIAHRPRACLRLHKALHGALPAIEPLGVLADFVFSDQKNQDATGAGGAGPAGPGQDCPATS